MKIDILGNTKQEKKDYLYGKILRLADEIGEYDDALEFLIKYRSVDDLQRYLSEILGKID